MDFRFVDFRFGNTRCVDILWFQRFEPLVSSMSYSSTFLRFYFYCFWFKMVYSGWPGGVCWHSIVFPSIQRSTALTLPWLLCDISFLEEETKKPILIWKSSHIVSEPAFSSLQGSNRASRPLFRRRGECPKSMAFFVGVIVPTIAIEQYLPGHADCSYGVLQYSI